ncbi:MAG TPA: DUF445 domain-containing protein [Kouleothrix sp.]|uniref:DUF445 domain-containing protein n=1 Tax=Kouleothrix sp. TaxID=2779161 RepID=UPI002CA7A79D|nr:DUF445 domain-containing protein [Kouleothrix sp.]
MKLLATGLLVGVALLFVAALLLERRYAWVGFVRAFAEAAMVGALADWFAVTALFRHPLGLPIPHTAIIPRRKDSIGASIGRFIEDNFLSEEVLVGRLRGQRVVRRAALALSRTSLHEQIARHATTALNNALQVVNDADVQALVQHSLVSRVEAVQPAPLLGRALATLLAGRRQPELVYELVSLTSRLLEENKEAIRTKIRQETPWWLPRTVDRHISERLFDTVESALQAVGSDPNHPFHDRFNALLYEFVERLQHDPATIARGEELKTELLENPIVRDFSASLWLDIKSALLAQSTRPDSTLHQAIERAVRQFGELLLHDDALADKVDRLVERVVVYASREYRHQFGQLVAHTVSRWDAEATSRKIELQIGRDLQFIRINGTVVGGLAGLVIYCVSLLLR